MKKVLGLLLIVLTGSMNLNMANASDVTYGDLFVFNNVKSGLYLNNWYYAASGEDVNVANYSRYGQMWDVYKTSQSFYDPYVSFRADTNSSSLCLNVDAWEARNGDDVNLYTCSYSDTQKWKMEDTGKTDTRKCKIYIIRSADNPNLVLTARGTTNKSNVTITKYDKKDKGQLWSNQWDCR